MATPVFPIAHFGTSNVGRMKHVYRVGLGIATAAVMQAISGVHFNYSFPEDFWPVLARPVQSARFRRRTFRSERYFELLRNYRRHGWIVLYLFGISPAVCKSFLVGETGGRAQGADARNARTSRMPHRCA